MRLRRDRSRPVWHLLGSVAARMDATTLKRSRSCESSSERLQKRELQCMNRKANTRPAMSTQSSTASFTFVTGHEFGEATFRAILGLPEYGSNLKCTLLACLDQVKSGGTVGYTDLGPF